MRTLRSASVLLANTTSVECAAPLLAELGFSTDFVTLDNDTRDRFGIEGDLSIAVVSVGPGAMRAMVAESDSRQAMRDLLMRCARRLSSRTPHVLWTLIVIDRDRSEIAIACWYAGQYTPHVVALVASQRNIVDSDAETLCAMADAASDSDLSTHTRWLEILGRQSVSRKFFRTMASSISELAESLTPSLPHGAASELALLYLSRLLFLSFLETKGWLNGDHAFLANQFADCMMHGGRYHQRVLAPLFFGTLNTRAGNRAARARGFGRIPFLNGGLFTRSSIEKTHAASFFSDEALGDLFGQLLTRYRFTAREDSSVWSEAAVDPEMLGKAFESFMAAPDRKTSGAYYTPQELVEQLTTSAIASGVRVEGVTDATIVNVLAGQIPPADDRGLILNALDDLRVLDLACGSGAFLVHVLERLASLRIHLGDITPIHLVRRRILTRSIFGVDINPTAVWLCELRLWLSTAIQDPERDPMKVNPLPNLDRNIRAGDSLTGGSFSSAQVPSPSRIAQVRARYVRASGPRKVALAKMLDRLERDSAIARLDVLMVALKHSRREMLSELRSPDLFGQKRSADSATRVQLREVRESLRATQLSRTALAKGAALPFSYETHFADVASEGGFSVVIGNPPWVRLHNIDPQSKAILFREFSAFRESAWKSGAERASASQGFAAQIDLAALFVEQAVRLARRGGVIVLLVPAKLWRSLAGGGIRSHLLRETDLAEIHDLSESQTAFDAAVYPSILVARRQFASADSSVERVARAVVHRQQSILHWNVDLRCLPFDETNGSPWLIIPPDVRASFDAVRAAGIPLSESAFGRPLLGVKTGCNDAFVVRRDFAAAEEDSSLVEISSGDRRGIMERTMLRPMHRGETLRPWSLPSAPEHIVWTHGDRSPMNDLPKHAHRWLSHSRRELERRTDARGTRWWTIFRTESADSSKPRVAWSDFGKNPRAAVLRANDNTVLLNSCYVVRCGDMTDAFALTTLLNSPLAAAWLNTIAEPARGGFHRYLGWTVALLPIPEDWKSARAILAPLAKKAMDGSIPSSGALLSATVRVYGLHESDVEPLILWNNRQGSNPPQG